MGFTINSANIDDLPGVMELIGAVIQRMAAEGIHQWDSIYPTADNFASDINQRALFVIKQGGNIIAVMALNDQQSKEYAAIAWQYPTDSVLVVHRLAVHPLCQGQGVAQQMMAFAEEYGRAQGYAAIRLDAYTENPRAVALYEKQGYNRAGIIQFRKGSFWALEKSLVTSHRVSRQGTA